MFQPGEGPLCTNRVLESKIFWPPNFFQPKSQCWACIIKNNMDPRWFWHLGPYISPKVTWKRQNMVFLEGSHSNYTRIFSQKSHCHLDLPICWAYITKNSTDPVWLGHLGPYISQKVGWKRQNMVFWRVPPQITPESSATIIIASWI